ncbi:hypothetical protein O181_048929 [Austropuccinia psidii MF-1]|uniref:Uncharacterized protein n=1 Tax=Austropuccinia psidii MF-1 TaxID=1389203 RepID=A0A9Q3HNC3_9BASI|nr:hypothetical protein [Austropuccinia psidii MF-1]
MRPHKGSVHHSTRHTRQKRAVWSPDERFHPVLRKSSQMWFKATSEPNTEYTGLVKATVQFSEVKDLHFLHLKRSRGPFHPISGEKGPFSAHPALEFPHSKAVHNLLSLGK